MYPAFEGENRRLQKFLFFLDYLIDFMVILLLVVICVQLSRLTLEVNGILDSFLIMCLPTHGGVPT